MTTSPAEEFHLPWSWTLICIAVQLPFVALLFTVWQHVPLAVAVGLLMLFGLYAWLPIWGAHVAIGSEGINVYRSTYKVAWGDVTKARLISFLGCRYLRLQRVRGWTVWLPLDMVGHRTVEEALQDWTPMGNPIEQCIASK
jgi:hypothetical protein